MGAPPGSILKSRDGGPRPIYPPGIDLAREARTPRRRFYPIPILYTAYAVVILSLALRRSVGVTLAFAAAGVVIFSWLEYMTHRYVLHGRFPDGAGGLKHRIH